MSGEIFKHLTGKNVPATIEEADREIMRAAGVSRLPVRYRPIFRISDVSATFAEFDRLVGFKPPGSK